MVHRIPLGNINKIEQAIQFYTELLEFKILETQRDSHNNLLQVVVARGNNRIVIARQERLGECEQNPQIYLLIKNEAIF